MRKTRLATNSRLIAAALFASLPLVPSLAGAQAQAENAPAADTAGAPGSESERSGGEAGQLSAAELLVQVQGYLRAGRYPEAAAGLERAIAIDPENADAYALLGKARLEMGETEAAVEALGEAVRLQPGNTDSRIALGDAFRAAGENRLADEYYKDVLAIDPGNQEARSRLAALSQQRRGAAASRTAKERPSTESRTQRRSYPGVLILSYVLAPIVAAACSAAAESPAGLVFLLAPPVVHLAHGNAGGAGVAVLGMTLSTGLGALIGAGIAGASSEGTSSEIISPEFAGASLGALVGYTTWAIVDTALFAYREVSAGQNARRPAPRVMAGVAPVPGGAVGALARRF